MKLSDYAKVIQTVVGLTELSVVELTALVQKLLITETADLDTPCPTLKNKLLRISQCKTWT